jgi:hypothetical protein
LAAYVVIGTYDGGRFTLTEPPRPYALCVSSGERTSTELESLRAVLHDELDPPGCSVDGRAGQVVRQVIVDDGLQAELDQRAARVWCGFTHS